MSKEENSVISVKKKAQYESSAARYFSGRLLKVQNSDLLMLLNIKGDTVKIKKSQIDQIRINSKLRDELNSSYLNKRMIVYIMERDKNKRTRIVGKIISFNQDSISLKRSKKEFKIAYEDVIEVKYDVNTIPSILLTSAGVGLGTLDVVLYVSYRMRNMFSGMVII